MERLWAPWRMEYVTSCTESERCVFCLGEGGDVSTDRDRLVLYRSTYSFVMLNLYPYTNGHLMAIPFRHVGGLDLMGSEEVTDLMECVRLSVAVLSEAFRPQGYNIGMNLGKAGGAGVEEHLHFHVVPRWNGDTNFMSVVGGTRVIPEDLGETFDRLLPLFKEHRPADRKQ